MGPQRHKDAQKTYFFSMIAIAAPSGFASTVRTVPVTVTVIYADGKTAEHLVTLTEAVTEQRLPLTGAFRSVEVNQDGGAVAVIERR